MSWKKSPRILVFAAIPLLAGFLMVAQAGADQNTPNTPRTLGVILPGEGGDSGALSIVPADDSATKLELRRILFGWGKDKDKSAADKDASDKSDWDKSELDKDKSMAPSSPKSDRDTGSSGEGHSQSSPKTWDRDSMDRDTSGSDPTFRYIIWPFSSNSDKSADMDKQGSLSDQDSSMRDKDSSDRMWDKDSSLDRDKSSDLGPSTTDTGRDSGLRYIGDDSLDMADRDEADNTDEQAPQDNANEVIILAGMNSSSSTMNPRGDMDKGSTSSGMSSGSTTGSSGGRGMQDLGTGDTTREGTSQNGGSRNMDRGTTGGMSDRGTSTMDRGSSTMDRGSSSMDRGTSGNMGTGAPSTR